MQNLPSETQDREKISVPTGEGRINVASSATGVVYVSRRSVLYRLVENGALELFAGSKTSKGCELGHRLENATFESIRDVLVFTHSKLVQDPIIVVVEDDSNMIKTIINDIVDVFAGTGERGRRDGFRLNAQFSYPVSAVKTPNNVYFISDYNSSVIRRISEDGVVTTIGSGTSNRVDGRLEGCAFNYPRSLCLSRSGNVLVSEHMSHTIREIDVEANEIRTLVNTLAIGGFRDGPADTAQLLGPLGICHPNGTSFVVIADTANNKIRLFDFDKNSVTTVLEYLPICEYLTLTPNGDIYAVDIASSCLWKVKSFIPPFQPLYEVPFEEPFPLGLSTLKLDPYDSASVPIWSDDEGRSIQVPEYIIDLMAPSLNLPSVLKLKVPFDLMEIFVDSLYGINYPELFSTSTFCGENSDFRVLASLEKMAGIFQGYYYGNFMDMLQNLGLIELAELTDTLRRLDESHGSLFHDAWLELYRRHLSSQKSKDEISLLFDTTLQNLPLTVKSYFHNSEGIPLPGDLPPHFPLPPKKVLEVRLKKLWESVQGAQLGSKQNTKLEPTFKLSSGNKVFSAHAWLLYARWPFFRRMINSGLSESIKNHLELDPEFPIESFLFYLYNGEVSPSMTKTDSRFFISSGLEFNLLDVNDEPLIDFQLLIHASKSALSQPLTVKNVVDVMKDMIAANDKLYTDALNRAAIFLGRNFAKVRAVLGYDLATFCSTMPPVLARLVLATSAGSSDKT